ncbi:DUF6691 family protein [Pseudemcibacter aquimaris]|uniref:DUF6691 family protein n=1 Tax=Pseudemcibacter aquimaris TaxID=2857064 RepID=UPI002010E4B8|nr:DUF6691 family protein [Pseudemcibacter aquimaris]MCC3861508.1 YeeE/YedE family protein [Pseudemcibacter aquimaris]WDU58277.1 YeeE/YedE family protein [Pseudemcibacter aquimaris]
MGKIVFGFLAGLLFGIGLVVSGMSNPAKVLNFLDLFGTFDPSLMFVMGGAVVTVFIGYRLVLKRELPILSDAFQIPTRQDLDKNLIIGAAMFGIGWGIGGFCPGPAVTAITLGSEGIAYFFPAMIVGLMISKVLKS